MRMPDRLSLRLVLVLVPVNLLLLAVMFGTWLRLTETQLRAQLERQALSLSTQLSLLSAQALASHNEWLLPEHVQRFAELPGVRYATLLDGQGRVLADRDPAQVGKLAEGWQIGSRYTEPRGTRWGWASGSGRFLDYQLLEVVSPLESGGHRYGLVRLALDVQPARRQMATCYTILGVTGCLVTALLVLTLNWVARTFSRPILHVAEKAQLLALSWETEQPASRGEGQSEVGILSRALDQMVGSLRQLRQRQRLQRQDLRQRVACLLQAVQRVTAGDLLTRCESQGQGEIGRLESGFNTMVSRLVKTRQAELQARLDLEWTREALLQGNRRLAELDRRKTDFLNTASHELRTPLTSIRAFAEIVLDNEEEQHSPEEFLEINREFLEIIQRESERLSRLLHSLLDLSSIESGKIDWDFERLEAAELVNTTVTACRSLLAEKDMQLEVHNQPGTVLSGARDPLIQVLTNLLSNAIKFTPAGGRIQVRSRLSGEHVIFEVEDSGVGIAPEDQSKVFESFQQAEGQPDTGASRGSGLGLAIVKQIVEMHGGSLKLVSQLGKGSCFSARLPALREDEP